MDFSVIQDFDMQLLHVFNGSQNIWLDQMVMVLTSGFTWIPLYVILFVIVIRNNETMGQIALIVGCALLCFLMSEGLVDGIIKPIAARWRPSNDPVWKYTIQVVDNMRLKNFSFCSAHAANTFSIAIFFALLIRSRVVTCTLMLWSLANCWTRLYLGVHYPLDIICGLAVGAIIGSLIYLLYNKCYHRISPNIQYVSNQYTSTGYDYDDIDKIMTVMMFILVYVLLSATIKMAQI